MCLPVGILFGVLLITPSFKEITHSAPGTILHVSASPSRYSVERDYVNNYQIFIRNKKLKAEVSFVLVKGMLFKVGLSPYLLEWKPFKSDENYFLIYFKALFLLKIYKVLSRLFGLVGKTTWLER